MQYHIGIYIKALNFVQNKALSLENHSLPSKKEGTLWVIIDVQSQYLHCINIINVLHTPTINDNLDMVS
jgi:hypothetical protein